MKKLTLHAQLLAIVNDFYEGNQSAFARDLGVSPQAVQKWIAKKASPRIDTVMQISELVGWSPEYLLFGGPESESGGSAACITKESADLTRIFSLVRGLDKKSLDALRVILESLAGKGHA